MAWSSLSNTDSIQVIPGLNSQYVTSGTTSAEPLMGLGVSYVIPEGNFALGLGVQGYYLYSAQARGINTPADTDPLNYTANGESYALMFEPKLMYTQYNFQPYVLAGVGRARVNFSNYSESPVDPSGTAGGGTSVFSDAHNNNTAFEVGVGVQYLLGPDLNAPIVSLDYRYINWGKGGMAPALGQLTQNAVQFGNLTTSSINLSLTIPF